MEPQVIYATVRDSEDDKGFPVLDIECRFSDGQKFAAVQVDGEFPELAMRIAKALPLGYLGYSLMQKAAKDEVLNGCETN